MPWLPPAATSEPTSEMPEMALVPPSAACAEVRHLRDDLVADEPGEHEDVEARRSVPACIYGGSFGRDDARCTPEFTTSPPWVMTHALGDFVAEIDLSAPRRACGGAASPCCASTSGSRRPRPCWQVLLADDRDAVDDRCASPGLAELAVAALLGREIDDDRAAAHAAHHLGGDQDRRAAPGNQRGGDARVGLARCAGEHLGLLLLVLLGDLLARSRPGSARPRALRPRRTCAPRLSTCSFTTLRTSNASTTAPSRRAVAMA